MKQYNTHFGKLWLRDELDLYGFIQNGCYEPDETKVVQSIIKPGWSCLDIGANIGYYTALMAELGAWVDAFEPNHSNFNVLEQNTQQYDRVATYQLAVSDMIGFKQFYTARVGEENINHGMHRMYSSKWCRPAAEEVKTITIDSLSKTHLEFVKIDVEGWEPAVIAGMTETIKRLHPTMLIEFHPPTFHEAGFQPYHLYTRLLELGYDIYLIPDVTNPISFDNLLRESSAMSGRNVLCIPIK